MKNYYDYSFENIYLTPFSIWYNGKDLGVFQNATLRNLIAFLQSKYGEKYCFIMENTTHVYLFVGTEIKLIATRQPNGL